MTDLGGALHGQLAVRPDHRAHAGRERQRCLRQPVQLLRYGGLTQPRVVVLELAGPTPPDSSGTAAQTAGVAEHRAPPEQLDITRGERRVLDLVVAVRTGRNLVVEPVEQSPGQV